MGLIIDTSIEDIEYTLPENAKIGSVDIENRGNGILTIKHNDLSIPVMPNFRIRFVCTGFHSCLIADKEVYYYDQILIERIK